MNLFANAGGNIYLVSIHMVFKPNIDISPLGQALVCQNLLSRMPFAEDS